MLRCSAPGEGDASAPGAPFPGVLWPGWQSPKGGKAVYRANHGGRSFYSGQPLYCVEATPYIVHALVAMRAPNSGGMVGKNG